MKELPSSQHAPKMIKEKKPVFKPPKSPAEVALAAARKAARRESAAQKEIAKAKAERRSSMSASTAPPAKRRPRSAHPPRINQEALAEVRGFVAFA